MHDESGDELRSLRERAYGPNADIHEDPAAMARLHELEAQATRPVPVSGAAPEAWAPTAADDPRDDPDGETDAAPGAATHVQPVRAEPESSDDPAPDPDPEDDPDATPDRAASGAESAAVSPRRRRRGALIWAGALTLAVLVGAGVTYTALQQNPGNVGVLSVDADAEFPSSMGEATPGSRVYEEFYGLTVLLIPQNWGTGNPAPCLFVLPAGRDASIVGVGCGAGEFEPTAAVEVTRALPDELLERFPEDSALQFVLRDGEVVVYSDED